MVGGKYYFPFGRVKIEEGKKCMVCRRPLPIGFAISPHDPNRSKSEGKHTVVGQPPLLSFFYLLRPVFLRFVIFIEGASILILSFL